MPCPFGWRWLSQCWKRRRVALVACDSALSFRVALALPVLEGLGDHFRPEQLIRPSRRWQSQWRPTGGKA